ncbi:response regulator transcription factor [Paenibacillus sp. GCM10027627]|uniref:response regulator transcription factor n=1 Tax=unclassified Paenibacillus TaxID=185978 RepID=UPI00363267A4
MKKILVVEDDREINQLIVRYLEKEGFELYPAYDGNEAFSCLTHHEYQLAIVDLMLPHADGHDVLRKIRAKGTIPVIILSAKDREMDKILALELGADDYMTKPFTIGELVARAKAQLRRYTEFQLDAVGIEAETIKHADLVLNLNTGEAVVDGRIKTLTAKEFAILKLFLTHPGRVFTKSQIYERVWREESLSDENTIMVHINRLRSKIEKDPSTPAYIQTVWGFGYKLGER